MKSTCLLSFWLTALTVAGGDLDALRALLRENPTQAAAALHNKLAHKPKDPWRLYNAGVASYAAGDFEKADETWQQLTRLELPEPLRDMAWLQIGNVSYRLAEPHLDDAPDTAIPKLEQAREAYQLALSYNEKNAKARHNLALVEALLEKLYARLAEQLAQAAAEEASLDDRLARLETALSYAQQAESLNPSNPERVQQTATLRQTLVETLNERASLTEAEADEARDALDEENFHTTRSLYEQALADFRNAHQQAPENREATEGQDRVAEKLAQLLTDRGQELLAESHQQAHEGELLEAIRAGGQALQQFQDAQTVLPGHGPAQEGETAARDALAQWHEQRGDQQTEYAAEQAPHTPAEAVRPLSEALAHYETAHSVAPETPSLPPKIEATIQQLAELLEQLGQVQLQAGTEAENDGDEHAALPLYAEALQQFSQAEAMQPQRASAREGREAAQAALERLRARQKATSSSFQLSHAGRSFEELLRQYRDHREWLEHRPVRRQPDVPYYEVKKPALRDW